MAQKTITWRGSQYKIASIREGGILVELPKKDIVGLHCWALIPWHTLKKCQQKRFDKARKSFIN